MTTKAKSHKAMGDGEWMERLRAFASTGTWPPGAGNRPAPRQRKWHDLYQKIEKCPMQARGQSALFGQTRTCNCGFHARPVAQQSPHSSSAASASASEALPRTYLRPPPSLSMFTKSHYGGSLSSAVRPNLVTRRTPSPSSSPVRPPNPTTPPSSVRSSSPSPASVRTPSPSLASVRSPSPSLASVRTPSPSLASVRSPSPSLASVRSPSPSLASVRTPSPSLASVRSPSPSLASVRSSSPSPASVRSPSPSPASVRSPSPSPASVRSPSPSLASVRSPNAAASQQYVPDREQNRHQVDASGEPGGLQPHVFVAPSFCLPGEWSRTIPLQDQKWIANSLFHSGKLRTDLKLWYEPPVPALIYHQTPTPERFFTHRLMVWMPYHLWKVKIACPACGKQLTGAGVHKRARKVLDIDRYYLMVTETLRCSVCVQNHLSTSQTVRDQLDLPHQRLFRIILTCKYACDIRVIRLLRDRTLGNSPARLVKQLKENHGEEWLNRLAHYLGECAEFVDKPSLFPVVCQEPPEPMDIPTSRWLLAVYGRDILSRMDHIKASITSTFGSFLKLDSTKKITKKLAGTARGTALWLTSVSNEVGQILISVLSVQEGPGLNRMASGLMNRYRQAAVPPPVLLYVDCGCCVDEGTSKLQVRFGEWPDLHIRLDIWHFMRRLAVGCTTDAHPLYPTFMGCLSACIFEWDAGDLTLLRQAKREQLRLEGVPGITDLLVDRRISKTELSQNCRRRTRGEEETIHHIDRLLQELGGAKGRDLMGVPLLDQARMDHIWRVQKRHVKCIQDVPGVQLYKETGTTTTRGGTVLKKYRCARGSTSLESFHCHLNRFIPGTSANALNFQLYLLEGLNRWNQDRGSAAVDSKPSPLLTYAGDVAQCVNTLSSKVFNRPYLPAFRPPAQYTGELIGVDYMLSQTGQPLNVSPDSEETEGMLEEVGEEQEDEGFEEDQEFITPTLLTDPIFSGTCLPAAPSSSASPFTASSLDPAASSSSSVAAPTQAPAAAAASSSTFMAAPTLAAASSSSSSSTFMAAPTQAPAAAAASSSSFMAAPTLAAASSSSSSSTFMAAPTQALAAAASSSSSSSTFMAAPTQAPAAAAASSSSFMAAPTLAAASSSSSSSTFMAAPTQAPAAAAASSSSFMAAPTLAAASSSSSSSSFMPAPTPAPAAVASSSLTGASQAAAPLPPLDAPSAPSDLGAVDESSVPGMDRVDSLAELLVELRNQPSLALTNQQVSNIVALWQNLLEYDKQRVVFAARHQNKLDTGRFRSPKKKKEFTPGVDSLKRHALTTTAPLAQWPDCCRLIEAICVRLSDIHRSPKKRGTTTMSRWDLILEDYRKIRRRILGNGMVMQQTTLQLVDISYSTLVQWHNKRVKRQDTAVVLQGLNLPSRLSAAADPLPAAILRPSFAAPQPGPSHQYHLPSHTVGQAKTKKRENTPAAQPPEASARFRPPHQRQLFPAPPPPLPPGPRLVMLPPPGSQMLPAFLAAPQALGVTLPSAVAPAPASVLPPVRKRSRKVLHNTCKKCGQFRTAETGHSQYKGIIYCPVVEAVPKEQWLEDIKKH